MSECYIIKNGGHKVGDSHDLSLVRKSFLEMNPKRKGAEERTPLLFLNLPRLLKFCVRPRFGNHHLIRRTYVLGFKFQHFGTQIAKQLRLDGISENDVILIAMICEFYPKFYRMIIANYH